MSNNLNLPPIFPGFERAEVKVYGPRGNKRKSMRERKKWLEELDKQLPPPSGMLYYMDYRA